MCVKMHLKIKDLTMMSIIWGEGHDQSIIS
jgi:hypothetical protein